MGGNYNFGKYKFNILNERIPHNGVEKFEA